MQKQLIAIDGYSLMYRAYYALPDMTARDGTPTGALYGFLTMLLTLAARDPAYMLVAFDSHGPTFRHERYDAYKAGRKPMPDDLRTQLPVLKELLTKMGVTMCEVKGLEADDILGSIAASCEKEGLNALLVTGDRDALQLVSDTTRVLLTKRGISETVEADPAYLMETYGRTPAGMVDLKALMGDSSDNIPGVPGVGEKTAVKLLDTYGDLNGVLQHTDEIKGKLGERIRENRDKAELSYWLGKIKTDAELPITPNDCIFDPKKLGNAEAQLLQLELRNIATKLPKSEKSKADTAEREVQLIALEDEAQLTEALNTVGDKLALTLRPAVSFATDETTAYIVKQGETLLDAGLSQDTVLKAVAACIRAKKPSLLIFDAKTLLHRLFPTDADTISIDFDAMIADYLLNTNRPAGDLTALASNVLHSSKPTAALLFTLRDRMLPEMEERLLTPLYRDMELPLMRVLFSMEREGFLVDPQVLEQLHIDFSQRAEGLAKQIYEEAGQQFNILSPKQLGEVLFDKLGLPHGKKTKTGGYTTDADALEGLQNDYPIAAHVLEYRFLTKLDSTFTVAMLNKRDPSDGRIHTSFMQCVTATGRISSTEPNLQNIPVRTEQGREIRKAFIASPGNVLVGADYSQIELRLLAHISGDERFRDAFRNGEDIHARTAAEVFHVSLSEVTKEQRAAAKAVNFGIVYGISDFGLARNLGIPVLMAKDYIARYFERYPGVEAYLKSSVELARERGYAETIFHRRRPLPELASSNYNTRSFGERVAMNMPIQGSAADVIKLAMVAVKKALDEGGFKAKLILQIHDELIVDTPENEAEQVFELLKRCMEGVAPLTVKLEADAKIGHSWFDTK